MTAPPEVAGETLYAAFPPAAQLRSTRTKRFDHLAAQAFDRGWSLEQLVHRLTSGDLGVNPGGVITSRLEWCAEHPAPHDGRPVKVHDGCCDGGWLYDETVDPVRISKCPGSGTTS